MAAYYPVPEPNQPPWEHRRYRLVGGFTVQSWTMTRPPFSRNWSCCGCVVMFVSVLGLCYCCGWSCGCRITDPRARVQFKDTDGSGGVSAELESAALYTRPDNPTPTEAGIRDAYYSSRSVILRSWPISGPKIWMSLRVRVKPAPRI